MKTPEELAREGSTHRDGCEKGRRFNIPCSCGSFEKTLRAIRLGQAQAWREAALIVEDLLQEHVIYGVKLTAQGLDDRIKKLRAKADAIEKKAAK